MNDFWASVVYTSISVYILLICFFPLLGNILYDEVKDPNKRKAYIALAALWPISIILFAPIILVFGFKFLAIGSNSALGFTMRGLGEVGNIYKAVIKR